ncbi:MAG: hypothetical protein A4E58_02376 [Syntrophorhabdus sp. PtaB.Bin006]|nr:MAG: hypothetical protein A4E58_02376 [Syntrophorhabdus sp. PtaB.Bin006]
MDFLKYLIKGTYYKHQHYNRHDYGFQGGFKGIPPTDQFLRKGKKLVFVLIAIIGVVLLLLVALLIALSPTILSGIDWVYHNGINGIVKLLLTILDRLWKGAGA